MEILDYSALIHILEHIPSVPAPVILPDFFVDHFVITDDLETFISRLRLLAEQGGGNLMGTRHLIRRGGNAVNTASALFALGIRPVLIAKTDPRGLGLLKGLVDPQLDLTHIHTDGMLSATVSIEADYQGRRVNLMVSDSGSVADFSLSDLNESDIECIRRAPLVALLCLNHNRLAPSLAGDLFSMVRSQSHAITFMDIGDPSGNPSIVKPIVDNVLMEGLVDVLSMNENEAGWFARALDPNYSRWTDLVAHPDRWLSAAEYISSMIDVQVDLHTHHFAASSRDGVSVVVPAFDVAPHVVCGAGDAWNAGDICGNILHLNTRDRLTLANAVAALYVSGREAMHPSSKDVVSFLRSSPRTCE